MDPFLLFLLLIVLVLAGLGAYLGQLFIETDARVKLGRNGDGEVAKALEELRSELAEVQKQVNDLRDTATEYDISFDTALRRLDQRVQQIETQRVDQGNR